MGKVKDKLREYNRSKNFLDTLCKAYFDATAPKGRSYVGWKLSDEHPNCVGIGYDLTNKKIVPTIGVSVTIGFTWTPKWTQW